jgi:hypothetical protein
MKAALLVCDMVVLLAELMVFVAVASLVYASAVLWVGQKELCTTEMMATLMDCKLENRMAKL